MSQLNSHLSNYIMQVGLRGLEVSVEADGVASRKRSAVNAREDFEQLNSIAQNLLDQYRLVIERAPQGDRASAEAAVLRSTAQALQAVLANAVADANAELEKVDREISATNLMLMTGSVNAIR
ncbi:MAG: hypothetical protein EOP05_11690 [Proteobacteria bacterium]|nr:MAG: hypothetical protein EOP05_11690 [Pseudomonadota bacterium]